jgi:hypothetical protein
MLECRGEEDEGVARIYTPSWSKRYLRYTASPFAFLVNWVLSPHPEVSSSPEEVSASFPRTSMSAPRRIPFPYRRLDSGGRDSIQEGVRKRRPVKPSSTVVRQTRCSLTRFVMESEDQ